MSRHQSALQLFNFFASLAGTLCSPFYRFTYFWCCLPHVKEFMFIFFYCIWLLLRFVGKYLHFTSGCSVAQTDTGILFVQGFLCVGTWISHTVSYEMRVAYRTADVKTLCILQTAVILYEVLTFFNLIYRWFTCAIASKRLFFCFFDGSTANGNEFAFRFGICEWSIFAFNLVFLFRIWARMIIE